MRATSKRAQTPPSDDDEKIESKIKRNVDHRLCHLDHKSMAPIWAAAKVATQADIKAGQDQYNYADRQHKKCLRDRSCSSLSSESKPKPKRAKLESSKTKRSKSKAKVSPKVCTGDA